MTKVRSLKPFVRMTGTYDVDLPLDSGVPCQFPIQLNCPFFSAHFLRTDRRTSSRNLRIKRPRLADAGSVAATLPRNRTFRAPEHNPTEFNECQGLFS